MKFEPSAISKIIENQTVVYDILSKRFLKLVTDEVFVPSKVKFKMRMILGLSFSGNE